jgi:hypothetical protein
MDRAAGHKVNDEMNSGGVVLSGRDDDTKDGVGAGLASRRDCGCSGVHVVDRGYCQYIGDSGEVPGGRNTSPGRVV